MIPVPAPLVSICPSQYTNMNIDEAIDRMMTCATAERCAREEACFRVVVWAKEQRATQRTREAARVTATDEIAHYAPMWEGSVGLPTIDWDAA